MCKINLDPFYSGKSRYIWKISYRYFQNVLVFCRYISVVRKEYGSLSLRSCFFERRTIGSHFFQIEREHVRYSYIFEEFEWLN